MKKTTIIGTLFLLIIVSITTAQFISENPEIRIESKEIFDYLEKEGLTEFKRTPCIIYSETHCRVEDRHSGSGQIVRFDIAYNGKTEQEIEEEALAEIRIQLNDYARRGLSTTTTITFQSITGGETIKLIR